MSEFRRFAPIEVRFLPFGYFTVDKNREKIRDFRIWEGEKIRIFGQNIYPWVIPNIIYEIGVYFLPIAASGLNVEPQFETRIS